MANRILYFLCSVLFLIFLILSIIIVSSRFETRYGEGLCVDGDGDINLEGIMCVKETYSFFGFDVNSIDAQILQMLFALFFIFSFLAMIDFFCARGDTCK